MARIEGAWPGVLLLLAGCGQPGYDAVQTSPAGQVCGPAAAMSPRARDDYRDHPPACELPTAEDLARSCASHDAVRTPGYRSPEPDETGILVGGDPLPEYRVQQVDCAFTDSHRNRAQCRFMIQQPGSAQPVPASVSLTNQFYADHGPAHHVYWAFWQVDASCLPAS